jgi:hypothetical protein
MLAAIIEERPVLAPEVLPALLGLGGSSKRGAHACL